MKTEWILPVVLGLLVAGALWALVPHDKSPSTHEPNPTSTGTATQSQTPTPPPDILLPFAQSKGPPGGNTTHIVLAPNGKAAFQAKLNQSSQYSSWGDFDWQGDHVAFYTADNVFAGCQPDASGQMLCSDPVWAFYDWPLPRTESLANADTSPRFGVDGYWAGNVTAYVFNEAGFLMASNALPEDAARLAGTVEYTKLPQGVWYLGPGDGPNGTEAVPSLAQPFVDRLMPTLLGQPVGGVASARSNAYVGFYGTLFVTLRIDSLVQTG